MNISNSNFKTTCIALCMFVVLGFQACTNASEANFNQTKLAEAAPEPAAAATTSAQKKIKIALLLDTSNSMDGLIEQAKSQLWKFVNALAGARYDNEKPQLELALYEYGNDGLPASEGHIRQVADFTKDLDLVSEKLFSLRTNGGNEFCGQVIQTSLKQLDWNGDDADLKVIFIAGNEAFTQGRVHYKQACSLANEKNVVVNTIFCGDFETGILRQWKSGADLTQGSYMSINHNSMTAYISSPFDDDIAKMNDKLNDTYLYYGKEGKSYKSNQLKQDKNAEVYGKSNVMERTLSKSSGFYKNESWDLVDATKQKSFQLSKVREEELPEELKRLDVASREKAIKQKSEERELIKKQISDLNQLRLKFLATQTDQKTDDKSLDAAMLKAIREQATKKGFVFVP